MLRVIPQLDTYPRVVQYAQTGAGKLLMLAVFAVGLRIHGSHTLLPLVCILGAIMLIFGVIMLDGVFAKMLMMGSLRAGKVAVGGIIRIFAGQDYFNIAGLPVRVLWLDLVLFGLLVADLLIRYSQHLRDEEPSYGFLEWVFRSRKKSAQLSASE